MIDNWRWHGVPFYLRSGKRMPRRVTEIAIQFRTPPHLMFPLPEGEVIEPNTLAIRIQPDEGISLRFEVKVPGVDVKMASVDMDFSYAEAFGEPGTSLRDAAARLHAGRRDAVHPQRRGGGGVGVVDPIIDYWANKRPDHFPNYAAGTWGPEVADEFIAREGAAWRRP